MIGGFCYAKYETIPNVNACLHYSLSTIIKAVKSLRAQFVHKNNHVKKYKIEVHVPYASFEENYAKTRTFSNKPFNMRENHFLVHGQIKDVPKFYAVFIFKICFDDIFKSQTYSITFIH